MDDSTQFPNDNNGDVLRRMQKGGDDLTQPRMIDYCFLFSDRRQALAFAEAADDVDSILSLSLNKRTAAWETIVQRFMIPEHAQITATEAELIRKAEAVGGKADGWGCFKVDQQRDRR